VGFKVGSFFLAADLEFVSVLIDGEASLFLEFGTGGGEGRVKVGLKGGGVGGNSEVEVEGALDFILHFATAREEALFEEFLGVEVDGVFGNFSANEASNIGTEICVKRSGPGREGRVQVSNGTSEEIRGGGCGDGDDGGDRGNEEGMLLGTPCFNFHVHFTDGLIKEGLTVDPGIKHGQKGSGSGEVRGDGEGGRLDAAEAVGAGNRAVLIFLSEEVKNPPRGFG